MGKDVDRFILHDVLEHNPAVRRHVTSFVPEVQAVNDWWGLCDALSGHVEPLVQEFLGNKSERVMLAALLMKADYAAQAVEVSPNFWQAWSGLDQRNKILLLDLLDEDI